VAPHELQPLSRPPTAKELDRTTKKLRETRSRLIPKALREWLDEKSLGSPGWPSLILEWQGAPDTPPFESYRGELLPPREDAFSRNTFSIPMC
jgi:hypothetical protein